MWVTKLKGNYLSKESDILTKISHQSLEEDDSDFTFFSLKLQGGGRL
jgi:hypothetical protein